MKISQGEATSLRSTLRERERQAAERERSLGEEMRRYEELTREQQQALQRVSGLTAEAAKELGVTNHVIRKLIKDGILPANQVVDGAPYQIQTTDLHSDTVKAALSRKGRPCRAKLDDQLSMFPTTYEGGA